MSHSFEANVDDPIREQVEAAHLTCLVPEELENQKAAGVQVCRHEFQRLWRCVAALDRKLIAVKRNLVADLKFRRGIGSEKRVGWLRRACRDLLINRRCAALQAD